MRAPARSAQDSSCSPAAARNVSPAARTTPLPCSRLAQGELADRRGLANPVHADEEPHGRPIAVGVGKRLDIALEHRDEIVLERLEESRRVGDRKGTIAQSVPKIPEDPRRRRDTHVGEDESLL